MHRLRVLVVSSEALPFAKTGGLADAVGGLAEALARLGHDVRVALPRYYHMDRDYLKQLPTRLRTTIGTIERSACVFEAERGARYYFVDNEELFGREGVYGPTGEESFPDNLLRFSFLCRSALELCRQLPWMPDLIHLHDWPGALTSVLLRGTDEYPDFSDVPTVLTIHNARYQGVFEPGRVGETGLSEEKARQLGLFAEDTVNLLSVGALYADLLTTVSLGYAREVTQAPYGAGLESLFRFKKIRGIRNGADYQEWDPESDRHLPTSFSASNLSGKRDVKAELLRRLGFSEGGSRPLVAMISRLTEQKGFDVLTAGAPSLLERIAELPVNIVVLGTGNPTYEEEIAALSSRRQNVVAMFAFEEGISHLVQGGSDFLLMPSKWEPCGLTQLYALRYATIPIVTNTGGLRDTVEDISEDYSTGTGIVLPTLDPESLLRGVQRAVTLYAEYPEALIRIRKRAMEQRFEWEAAAVSYLEVYDEAIRRSRRA